MSAITPKRTQETETHSPEVVHNDVEDAQNHDQDDRTPLRFEPNSNHHARHAAHNDDKNAHNAPVARKDETHEQEYKQYSPRQLEIHLAILLIKARKACRGELLAHPAIGEDHEESTHDAKIAEEEIEVED